MNIVKITNCSGAAQAELEPLQGKKYVQIWKYFVDTSFTIDPKWLRVTLDKWHLHPHCRIAGY